MLISLANGDLASTDRAEASVLYLPGGLSCDISLQLSLCAQPRQAVAAASCRLVRDGRTHVECRLIDQSAP